MILIGLSLAVGMASVALLRMDTRRLRQRIADVRREKEQSERLRADNQQARAVLSRTRADRDDGARAVHEEVVRLRGEVADLEKRAEESRAKVTAQQQADAEALASNRDPQKGLMRLENFKNVGQVTPGAAFQTFVWAAMKGEDATLAGMIAFSGAALDKGEAVVAALPDAARAKYLTPERLAALFFADALTGMSAAQIVGVAQPDAEHAVVTVRGLTDKEQRVPLQLGASGWQIVVPEGMVGKLAGWARGGASPAAAK